MKGELTAEEDLLIQGRFEGSVKHNARNLTVGAHGDVEADIDGKSVVVQGTVQGDIRGKESVIIEPSARVKGNVYAASIGLKEGAKFKGRIDSYVDSSAPARQKAAGARSPVGDEVVDAILDA